MAIKPSIAFLVSTTNQKEEIVQLLETFIDLEQYFHFSIFILDNASESDQRLNRFVKETDLPIVYSHSSQRLNFAASYNSFFRGFILQDYDLVVIVDKVLNLDIHSLIRTIKSALKITHDYILGIPLKTWILPQIVSPKSIGKVVWLQSNIIMLRPEVIRKLGLFDERYYLDYEVIDYCWRAYQLGVDIQVIRDDLKLEILQLETTSQLKSYFMGRNPFLFTYKHFSLSSWQISFLRLIHAPLRILCGYTLRLNQNKLQEGVEDGFELIQLKNPSKT